MIRLGLLPLVIALTLSQPVKPSACTAAELDLSAAVVIISDKVRPSAETQAAAILIEEVFERTGLNWSTQNKLSVARPDSTTEIVLACRSNLPGWSSSIPEILLQRRELTQPEAFCIDSQSTTNGQRIYVIGSDSRGVMFGVGQLLRSMKLMPGSASLAAGYQRAVVPDRAIRGHQIGYRPRANSWDAWTIEQFDQYARDLVIFGTNCLENIPFQDTDRPTLMKYPREQMNIEFAKICDKYDLDHWVWVPIEFTVQNELEKGNQFLETQEKFYRDCPRLDAIFVPGGDPGHNSSQSLLPYLERMARVVQKYHPRAKIWMSLQGFKSHDIDDFYSYLEASQPDWFGGAVMGPSSPGMEVTRQRLPARYRLRWYPDITHNVRCQYPIPWLDPVWGLVIGREGVNPRPQDLSAIYLNDYRLTDGFLSYSDGIHDDFNKCLWSALAVAPHRSTREIATEYARYFFRADLAELGADGLFALEANHRGPASSNGSVSGTLKIWQELETRLQPNSKNTRPANWRFDLHLLRAYIDAYTQSRLHYETTLEAEALEHLSKIKADSVQASLDAASMTLAKADTAPIRPDLKEKIEQLADSLFERIAYQTSVAIYGATGHERGCMLDYISYPLNNRWWIEDQMALARQAATADLQATHLKLIVDWENPGPGGYYEAIGQVGKSRHMVKLWDAADAIRNYRQLPIPTQRNIGPQRNGLRLSFHVYHDDLPTLKFNALDPNRTYTVKLMAQRESPLQIDGQLAEKIRTGQRFDELTEQEFAVPAIAVQDGTLELSWAKLDEQHLNWRQRHYVTDLWIICHP